jgi:hypothetical protein
VRHRVTGHLVPFPGETGDGLWIAARLVGNEEEGGPSPRPSEELQDSGDGHGVGRTVVWRTREPVPFEVTRHRIHVEREARQLHPAFSADASIRPTTALARPVELFHEVTLGYTWLVVARYTRPGTSSSGGLRLPYPGVYSGST